MTRAYTPQESVLGVMARDLRFIKTVYRKNAKVLRSVVGSRPYNLTVYARGLKVLSIGREIENVPAVIQLTGYRGRVKKRLAYLVVGG